MSERKKKQVIVARKPEPLDDPNRVEAEPIRGRVEPPPEKELPVAHLGQEHPPENRFTPEFLNREETVIYGKTYEAPPPKVKPPPGEPTQRFVSEGRKVEPYEWGSIGQTPIPTTRFSPGGNATGFTVIPIDKEKKDGAHKKT